MRTITKKIDIYKFDELNENIQNEIINNYIDLYIYFKTENKKIHKNSNIYKAIKKAEDLSTPWFMSQYVWDYCKKDILKDLKKFEYYKDGGVYYEDQ